MLAKRTALLGSVPLLLFAGDALAWGLYTHVYFAQLLVWAVPLLDPTLRRAVRRFPARLMAGACLPDLALVGSTARTRAFDDSHRWETAHALLQAADDDETRACAVGAISHLWVDIIAHNHFVPAHEHLWWNVPMLTHAASEWAMDRQLSRASCCKAAVHPPPCCRPTTGWSTLSAATSAVPRPPAAAPSASSPAPSACCGRAACPACCTAWAACSTAS
jgi:hypothetical protein